MKNLLKIAAPAIIAAAAIFPATSNALTIGQVGGFDQFLGSTTLASSGNAVETAWVASVLNVAITDVTMTFKEELGDDNWTLASDSTSLAASGDTLADDYYFDLSFGGTNTDYAEYFMLKLGNGGVPGMDTHYLYKNLEQLNYALVDFSAASPAFSNFGVGRINVGRISHTDGFDTNTTPVSEPSILGLMGLGMIGLGLSRRRLAIRK